MAGIYFRQHATDRMLERNISNAEVLQALLKTEVVEDYPNEQPLLKQLLLGWAGHRPLHIAVGNDTATGDRYIITVYKPMISEWGANYKTKKR